MALASKALLLVYERPYGRLVRMILEYMAIVVLLAREDE